MTYRETVLKIREALIKALTSCEAKIRAIGTHPIGTSRINGVAVEIIPFQQVFSIHFRDDQDKRDTDFPSWRHWGLYDGNADNQELLDALERQYQSSEDREQYMLMLGTAVADALLCDDVLRILRSYSMAEHFDLNALGNCPFDFVVLDLDDCVQANFCDIVRWKRNIPKEAMEQ